MTWGIVAFLFSALVATWIWIAFRRSDRSLPLIQQQLTSLNEQLSRSIGEVSSSTGTELNRLHERIDKRLSETSQLLQGTQQSVGERLDKNTQVFNQIHEKLGRLEETNKQIRTIGEEIAQLQDILRVPKLRGNLGELFLEELLAQILPPTHYDMQYTFKSGDRVDAIIRLPQGNLVPVDAKFPLENFQRMVARNTTDDEKKTFRKAFTSDFRKHVDQIASKYILPDEGTLDFALLYIPAENIYYEVILCDDRLGEPLGLNTYALQKRVIPVSPSSLYAYLQLIVLGLRGLRIEDQAREIITFLSRLQGDLEKLRGDFDLVGKHLTNSQSAFERSEKRLGQLRDRVQKVEGSRPEEVEAPEKPRILKGGSS